VALSFCTGKTSLFGLKMVWVWVWEWEWDWDTKTREEKERKMRRKWRKEGAIGGMMGACLIC
jgi:hypothetical protein